MRSPVRLHMLAVVALLVLMPTAAARDPLKDAGIPAHIEAEIEADPMKCLQPYVMGDSGGRSLGSIDAPTNIFSQDRKIGIVLLGASFTTDDGYYGVRVSCQSG